jgi:hypothetical protein
MATWTREDHLTFDIAFALKKVTVPGFRKALKEEDRFAIANTIREHLWRAKKKPLRRGELGASSGSLKGGTSDGEGRPITNRIYCRLMSFLQQHGFYPLAVYRRPTPATLTPSSGR